jgi:K+-sensing histidine kinase KdpD
MSGIVCAIRGGPDSRPTINKAISLAAETDQCIYFLYVVNLDFLTHTQSSRIHSINAEMRQMGEFILLSAQTTAASKNVEAQGVVRQGNVGEEIVGLCHEVKASYVILGTPQSETEENIFSIQRLNTFRERLESETGAKVILVGGETE